MKNHLSFVCVGIAAAALTPSFMSAVPATGQQPPAKQKWEYKLSDRTHPQDVPALLSKLGEDGWELVTVQQTDQNAFPNFYFKRPK